MNLSMTKQTPNFRAWPILRLGHCQVTVLGQYTERFRASLFQVSRLRLLSQVEHPMFV